MSQGALKIVEREADEFDEEAVHELLKQQVQDGKTAAGIRQPVISGGCPSTALKTFSNTGCDCVNQPRETGSGRAVLSGTLAGSDSVGTGRGPVLENADLVIAADCVPVAYPSFHKDFLAGRAVMIGCPKFDDTQGYVDKLTDVFKKSGIKKYHGRDHGSSLLLRTSSHHQESPGKQRHGHSVFTGDHQRPGRDPYMTDTGRTVPVTGYVLSVCSGGKGCPHVACATAALARELTPLLDQADIPGFLRKFWEKDQTPP